MTAFARWAATSDRSCDLCAGPIYTHETITRLDTGVEVCAPCVTRYLALGPGAVVEGAAPGPIQPPAATEAGPDDERRNRSGIAPPLGNPPVSVLPATGSVAADGPQPNGPEP